MSTLARRRLAAVTAVLAVGLALQRAAFSDDALAAIRAEIARRHDEGVHRLQDWVRQPSIAAENRGMNEGCELMMRLAREAGFQKVQRVDTDGKPGVFATLDAGARRREPEGPRGRDAGGASCLPGRRAQTARQLGPGGGRRGGDRLAALPPD